MDHSGSLPDEVQYSHFLFAWERKWAASGVRRLSRRGDPSGFLAVGLEAYGYFASAFLWGAAAGVLVLFVCFPLLVAQGGASLASWFVYLLVLLLVAMAFVRLRQSKLARTQSAKDSHANDSATRPGLRRQKFVTWAFLVSAIYLGVPGLVLASKSGDTVVSLVLCLAAVGSGWLGVRHLRRLRGSRPPT